MSDTSVHARKNENHRKRYFVVTSLEFQCCYAKRLSKIFHELATPIYCAFFVLLSSYLLQLNVFFEELNYELIEESMGYEVHG